MLKGLLRKGREYIAILLGVAFYSMCLCPGLAETEKYGCLQLPGTLAGSWNLVGTFALNVKGLT
jgi:hypothetical protein